jgi:hypothetical protein
VIAIEKGIMDRPGGLSLTSVPHVWLQNGANEIVDLLWEFGF